MHNRSYLSLQQLAHNHKLYASKTVFVKKISFLKPHREIDCHASDHKIKHEQHKQVLDVYFYSKKIQQDFRHSDKQNDPVHDYPEHFDILKLQ